METRTGFSDELKLIPVAAIVIAGLLFLCATLVVPTFVAGDGDTTRPSVLMVVVVFVGGLLAIYTLLVGYVNVDAKRRGMSRTLWTLVVIFVPNALGFILYFLMRQPVRSTCPQCASLVEPGTSYCPRCGKQVGEGCPSCHATVGLTDAFCVKCGHALREAAPEQA